MNKEGFFVSMRKQWREGGAIKKTVKSPTGTISLQYLGHKSLFCGRSGDTCTPPCGSVLPTSRSCSSIATCMVRAPPRRVLILLCWRVGTAKDNRWISFLLIGGSKTFGKVGSRDRPLMRMGHYRACLFSWLTLMQWGGPPGGHKIMRLHRAAFLYR